MDAFRLKVELLFLELLRLISRRLGKRRDPVLRPTLGFGMRYVTFFLYYLSRALEGTLLPGFHSTLQAGDVASAMGRVIRK